MFDNHTACTWILFTAFTLISDSPSSSTYIRLRYDLVWFDETSRSFLDVLALNFVQKSFFLSLTLISTNLLSSLSKVEIGMSTIELFIREVI